MSPLQHIEAHPGAAQGIRLFVKRDDLLYAAPLEQATIPFEPEWSQWVQGNKWRKLAPFLSQVLAGEYKGLLSYGGPFSNHLHALAAAGRLYGFPTAGIVRGLSASLENPTLKTAIDAGMKIHPVAKYEYNNRENSAVVAGIRAQYPQYLELPEGGAGAESAHHCRQLALEIQIQLKTAVPRREGALYVAAPAGTGTTVAGLVAGLTETATALVFPAAPYGLPVPEGSSFVQVKHLNDYIFGEFVVFRPELLTFARAFKAEYGILLDPVYTIKMMYGLFDLLQQGYFPAGSTVVAIHTGGLQGWEGFCRRFGYNESWCVYTGLPF